MTCDLQKLHDDVHGFLDENERGALRAHAAGCAKCREALHRLEEEREGLAESARLLEPAPTVPRVSWRTGWTIAAAIVLFGGVLLAILATSPEGEQAGNEIPAKEEPTGQDPPGRVTLQMRNADIKEVLDAAARQARADLIVSPDVRGLVTVDVTERPFADVVTHVARMLEFEAVREPSGIFRVISRQHARTEQQWAHLTGPEPVPEILEDGSVCRLTLNIKDADFLVIANLIGRISGRRVAPSPHARGSITMAVHDRPWNQALYSAAKTLGLVLVRDGDVTSVLTPLEALRRLEALERERLAPPGTDAAALNEREAIRALRTLDRVEMEFRSKDPDKNRRTDFWAGDVSGLYRLRAEGNPIALIDRELAISDAAPLADEVLGPPITDAPRPRGGYLFQALRDPSWESNWVIDDEDGQDRRWRNLESFRDPARPRFAFAAFPADYPRSSRRTFIIGDRYDVWSKDTGGRAPAGFPRDPEAEGWTRVW